MAPSQKVNLKDKVEDGEIDLSMCDLQDVPVKEIATIKNVFSLDMSNNHLIHLPKNFGTLTHLTKLDISKNILKDLPENFGDLIKLKHLDLYKNELQHLPLSFSKLKALKWLDLKDNPLVPAIKDKAGPCLDSKQCQTCAKNIVQFYTEFQQKVENEREVRDKQRQKDKQANELASQKQKQLEKKIKKKEKPKSKEYDEVVTDEMSTASEIVQGEEGNIKEMYTKQPNSYMRLVVKLLLCFLIILFVTLFALTSIQTRHTKHFERHVILQWNHIMTNLPPSIQQFGSDFGECFKALHTMTGNGILFLVNQLQEIQNEDNSIFKKIENYYNNFKGTVN